MTITEAYAAIDAVAKPDQSVFIHISCNWYDQKNEPRELAVEYRVSLVPGFEEACSQFESRVSLRSAVDQLLSAAAEAATAPAAIDAAEALLSEAAALPVTPLEEGQAI